MPVETRCTWKARTASNRSCGGEEGSNRPSRYSCLRGWAPTPTSSQPGGDLRHLAPYAAAAASFNLDSQQTLALQLLFWEVSESMGNHDSEVVDASSVD